VVVMGRVGLADHPKPGCPHLFIDRGFQSRPVRRPGDTQSSGARWLRGADASCVESRDLGGSAPALCMRIFVECRKLHGPGWCRVNQNGLGPEIRPLVADVATQKRLQSATMYFLG